jgi:pimeloyl-ACP methyl ester carboxylesterase
MTLCLAVLTLATAGALAQTPSPPGQLIDLGGRRLHLNCVGTGSPTVFVENGGGGFSVEWILVQQLVAKETRICTYDRAGYAWSDHGPMDEGVEQTMDNLHLLMRKASIPTPIIMVCQSLGCFFARAYQRRYPEQIAGLVFVDGSHDDSITLVLDGKRLPMSQVSRDQLPRAYEEYRRGLPTLKPGAANDPPYNRLPPDLQTARHWAFEKMVQEIGWLPNSLALAESWREELVALRDQRLSEPHPLGNLPMLVVERTKNTNESWHTQQEGSGHAIHIEQPELVASAIKQILATSSSPQRSAPTPASTSSSSKDQH